MKNYYEILEVNKNASAEIIDKAHKTLVKKYHPDLQKTAETKTNSEAKIKEINEAYEVLGNPEKRAEYDVSLAEAEAIEHERILQEKLEKKLKNHEKENNYNNNNNTSSYNNNEKINSQTQINTSNNNYDNTVNQKIQQDYQNAINKAYHDAYIQDLKNRGYKIKYKKTWNERLRSLIALLITIGIIMLVFQIPFVKNYFHSLYMENQVIHNIVDGFSSWFR